MKTLLIATFLLLTAPAFARGDCLARHDVDGWGTHGQHALIVNDRWRHEYLVSVAGWCSDLQQSWAISIRTLSGFDDNSCVGRGDRIVPRGPGTMPGESCTITAIEPYTADMQKAYEAELAARHHPHDN